MEDKKTFTAGLIGAHLSHSFSPRIHKALGGYIYQLFELTENELAPFLKAGNFDGLNVTVPYKKAVIPFLDSLSDTATRIGAVNTIVRAAGGSLTGHNTDYDGFSDLVRSLGVPLQGKKVLVLGSGGASNTAVTVAKDMGAKSVVVISRTGEDNYTNLARHKDADVLVNTTPVGMYPHNGEAPLLLSHFPHLLGVIDVIYNPAKTALLQEAESRGIPARNGLLMLVSQARRAVELFLDTTIEDSAVIALTERIKKDMQNIVFVGMPGCGKTTLGKAVANALNRPFIDCDDEFQKEAGMRAGDFITAHGEEAFRQCETAILARISKESGNVISTGGGVVTREENLPLLRQNSTVIFLDAAPDNLPTAGRPLSVAHTPSELYRRRLPLYRAAANITVSITRDIDENLKKLLKILT